LYVEHLRFSRKRRSRAKEPLKSGVLSKGRYHFVIRAVSKSGQEDDFDGAIEIEIGDMLPDGVGSLSAVRV